MDRLSEIAGQIRDLLDPLGFECHPFKIGWYNENVDEIFRFSESDDTLAFIVISTPRMFDEAFKPFVIRQQCTGTRDPIDECVAHHFQKIKEIFPSHDIVPIHDFEFHPGTRRAKVLVQTAGHVAGAAYYYQRRDVQQDPWKEKQKIYGVSIHPEFGGWFAFRGVLIFRDVQVPDLPRVPAPDILKDDQQKIKVLELFNYHWQDWTFRDIIEPKERYSEEQKDYFATLPKDRMQLIERMLHPGGTHDP